MTDTNTDAPSDDADAEADVASGSPPPKEDVADVDADDAASADEEVEWKSLTTYVTPDEYDELLEGFFMRLKLEYDIPMETNKRLIQQAVVQEAMEHSDEVIEHAYEVASRVDTTENDEAISVYMTPDTHHEFSKVFFAELQTEDSGLFDLNKRRLKQAALEVGMDYPENVAIRTRNLIDKYGDDG